MSCNHLTTFLRNFAIAGNELVVGGMPIRTIAAKYGTPFYVYDHAVLERKWTLLRNMLPRRFAIYYSIKANPNVAILRCFLEKGCGLEVASVGEVFLALYAGCPADRIIFAGPGKTTQELEYAISQGVGELHVESHLELERIAAISCALGRRTRIGLRINPRGEVQGGAQRMGGRSAPFGIDEENIESILDLVLREPSVEFCGIHLYVGTQILDHVVLLNQYRKGMELAKRLAVTTSCAFRTVDFGGGFGIPYFENEQELNTDELRKGLLELMTEYEHEPLLLNTQFMVEPGRFLVGDSGVYVVRVNDIKMSRGKKYVVVDGGMHHHLAASGNLGQIIKRSFPIASLCRLNVPTEEIVEIVGPLCTPLDVLGRSIQLPIVEVGDLIGVFQSGAYARTASPLGFLSHPAPPEILVKDGCDMLIRRREDQADLVREFPEASLAVPR
jgi:diaminopimelate decarboxylase